MLKLTDGLVALLTIGKVTIEVDPGRYQIARTIELPPNFVVMPRQRSESAATAEQKDDA